MKICILAEGCYPYVAGGVSSWIQMLIKGMPEHEFVICTIAANTDQKGKFKYELPENVVEVRENFLDQFLDEKSTKKVEYRLTKEEKTAVLELITKDTVNWEVLFEMFSLGGSYNINDFLVSEAFLEIVMEACKEKYRLTPFNKVFWTIRSMLLPIFHVLSCEIPEADLYHSVSTGYAGILGACFQYRTGKPYMITEHGIYTREREEEIIKASWVDVHFKRTWIDFFAGMSRAAYERANRIISLFYGAREFQIEAGAPEEKCIVIPNGIKLSRFEHTEEIADDGHPLTVGGVIRVVPIKDLKTMIYAFDMVKQKVPDARLYLIGPTDENPEYYQECQDLIRNLGCEDVTFTGRVDVAEWYGKMDILLLSSVSEGQPFAILEGMAARRPYVSTNVGSCRELLEGNEDEFGKAGEIVPVMNPRLMAKAILKIAGDRNQMRTMAENGYRRVVKYYQEEAFLSAYREQYIIFAPEEEKK